MVNGILFYFLFLLQQHTHIHSYNFADFLDDLVVEMNACKITPKLLTIKMIVSCWDPGL